MSNKSILQSNNEALNANNLDLQSLIDQANALPDISGEQATPVISVNSSTGLIIATAGTKSSTYQLAFQEAKTITPSTASQIAVSSGYYTGGNITVAGDINLVAENIVSGKSIFGVTGTATAGDDPFAIVSPFTYTVSAISGAQYGFTKNSNGYYESQNKGQNSSYAICRVNLTVTEACDIVFDVINYAESNYDYAVFGNLDSALALSNSADSNAKQNFKGQQSASVVNITYSGVTIGNHYIDIKFIKDSSQHKNNDSVQFKLQEQSSLPQETIDKILAADTDLIAENIKSGVSIFGVSGTLEEGGGSEGDNYDEADSLIEMTISEYTNSRVSSIGEGAFAYAKNLKNVSFPAATTIGDSAFYCCSKLTAASFPAITSIGNSAFYGCDSLTTVSFPNAITIGNSAFYGCDSLTTVSFPNAITIGNSAFQYCSSLTTVSFPAITSIGSSAFRNCSNLTTASFPAATTIGGDAFHHCTSLTTASFPAATIIGNDAFYFCSRLTTASFPMVTTIRSWAFYHCYDLTTASFPVAITIGSSAFDHCSRLTTASFPNATIISGWAFYYCSSLTTASFPNATIIGSSAFYYCSRLTSFYLTGSSIPTLSDVNAFYNTPISVSTYTGSFGSIFVPASLVASYQAATNWATYADRITAIE